MSNGNVRVLAVKGRWWHTGLSHVRLRHGVPFPLAARPSGTRPPPARVGHRPPVARRVLADVETRQACERVPDEVGVLDGLGEVECAPRALIEGVRDASGND